MGGRGLGGRRALGLCMWMLLMSIPAVLPRSFSFCKNECNARGTCQDDGTCACESGWAGEGCALEAPGISLERRRDGTHGYRFETTDEMQVGGAVFDPHGEVVYVYARDASGRDVIVELDPMSVAVAGTRGWDAASGPDRTTTTLVPETGYSGTGNHKRNDGYSDSSTSGGWYSVFRGLSLDLFDTSAVGVFAAQNMQEDATGTTKFRILRYISGPTESHRSTLTSGVVDALAANQETGHVVYAYSPDDGGTRSKVVMLDRTLSTQVGEYVVDADMLSASCSTCATRHDAFKFETATPAIISDGTHHVVFAGAALVDDTVSDIWYPTLFRSTMESEAHFVSDAGSGSEMYLDGSAEALKIPSACEGVVDDNQGRFTSFTALATRGAFGYVGTSGRDENCDGCEHRSACIFMFSLDFVDGDSPTAVIVLNGGDGGLGEKDVWSAAVQPDATDSNSGFVYFAVGSRSDATSGRIVKIEVGGSDTATTCVTGCFKRVGTYLESMPLGGLVHVPDLNGILAASHASASTTYSKYSTASVTGISPPFVYAETTGTMVTISGTGFYLPSDGSVDKATSISCRFGHTFAGDDDFLATAWKPAEYVSSTEILCEVPSAVDSQSVNLTFAEVEISFDGYPTADASSSPYFASNLWSGHNVVVHYYDAPFISAFDLGSSGAFKSTLMYTGEDPDNIPLTLRIYGSTFIDSDGSSGGVSRLACRFNGDSSSDIAATFVSPTEIHCPMCEVSNASGTIRCGAHGTAGQAQYIPFTWLTGGTPKTDVDVSITMNGVDYHSSAAQTFTRVLHVYGEPYGLSASHARDVAYAYPANANADGEVDLNTVTVNLIDVQGTFVENDMGVGNTRGFTIVAAINEAGSTGGSAATLSVTAASATQLTSGGTATFDLALSFVPKVGVYEVLFTGSDCTAGPCTALSATTAFTFSVSPGTAVGLLVRPGGSSGQYVTGPDFPEDTIDVSAAESVDLGYMLIHTIDAGGNPVTTRDRINHTITSTLVTTERDGTGVHLNRSTGAILGGTTTRETYEGEVGYLLTLESTAPSGTRTPGASTDISYGAPSRGLHGSESKYLIQFSSPTLSAVTHAVVRVNIGKAVYLRLNSTLYSVISMDATESTMLFPTMEIGAYDGGNNWLAASDTDLGNVTASSTSDPALSLSGTLSVQLDETTGTWTFDSLYAAATTATEYTLRFSNHWLASVDQIIEVTLGVKGHALVIVLPDDFAGTYTSTQTVALESMTVKVVDAGGNDMGSADRFSSSHASSTVARMLAFTSDTLELTGATATTTNGVVHVGALSLVEPKVGTHTITVSETKAVVNGANVGTSLLGDSFDLNITIGAYERLCVAGSPQTKYSPSFGANVLASEVLLYSSDRLTPLDVLTVNVADGGCNPIMDSGVFGTIAATLNDTSRELYPYVVGNNSDTYRSAVLVAGETSEFPRSGSLSAAFTSGVAEFSGLHLLRPSVGFYELTLTPTLSDPSVDSATLIIEVILGRSQMLALQSVCSTYIDSETNYTLCTVSSDCTCNRYQAAAQTALDTFQVFVLDAGLNPVLEQDTFPDENITQREVTVASADNHVDYCREDVASGTCECMGPAVSDYSMSDVLCSQVDSFSVIAVDGVAEFSGVYAMAPTISSAFDVDGYRLVFSSSGLLDLTFGIIVTEGAGYAFDLTPPEAFALPAITKDDLRSDFQTKITTPVTAMTLVLRIVDGGGNFVGDTEPRGHIIDVSCETATIGDYPQGDGQGGTSYAITCMRGFCEDGEEPGVAKFTNLNFMSPSVGEHVIVFSGLEVSSSFTVTVLVGLEAVGLKVVDYTEYMVEAYAETPIPSVEVGVVDAGNNLLGTTNPQTRVISCEIEGPRHEFDIRLGENVAVLPAATGTVQFSRMVLGVPQAGVYNLTFSTDGLNSVVLNITVVQGPASRLYIPVQFNTSSGVSVVPKSNYAAQVSTAINPLVVLVLDGGLNYVTDELVYVTVSADSGNITYTAQNSSLGYMLFDDIVFHQPAEGVYRLTFSTELLESIDFDVSIGQGYPAYVDVCDGNDFLVRDNLTGVCEEPETYVATTEFKLKSFQVRTLDGGRVFVGDTWNSEERNVTVELFSFTDADGEVHYEYPGGVSPLVADSGGTQRLIDGTTGWCTDGMDINPSVVETLNPYTGAMEYSLSYENSSPDFCREMSYSGEAPDVHYNAALKFVLPRAGTYRLQFTSVCEFAYCGNVKYPTLEPDTLIIRVIPGTPTVMRFVTEPPALNENDIHLEPAPAVEVFDVADNLCALMNTFLSATLSPRVPRVHGNVAPITGGRANFTSLRFSGERGVPYTMTFSMHTHNVSLDYAPFTLRPCEDVKPNSFSDERGICHCLPGYTEDTVNGTGYVDDLDNYNVAPLDLYKPMVFDSGDWLGALHPYGICVPCANGYYKPNAGAQACTKCADRFDTARINGEPSPPHLSSSGEMLAGPLGRTAITDCHCMVRLEAPPFQSYYQNVSTDLDPSCESICPNCTESFCPNCTVPAHCVPVEPMCEVCPIGGNCTGLGVETIGALPGFYRTRRDTTSFTECLNPEACLGGVDSTCLVANNSGFTGTLCANCLPGYAHPSINGKFPPRCVDCGNDGVNAGIFLLQWFAIIVVIAFITKMNSRPGSDAVCLVKTFVTYLQTVSIAKELNMSWPTPSFGLLLSLEKVSSFNLSSAATQCLLAWDYFSATGFYISLPLIVGTGGFVYFSVFKLFEDQHAVTITRKRRTKEDEESSESEDDSRVIKKSNALKSKARVQAMDEANFGESWESGAFDEAVLVVVIALWLMYPTLVQYLTGLMRCRRLDTGDDVFLIADMDLRCYDLTHGSWLFFLCILLVLYIIGIPLGMNVLLQYEGQDFGSLGMRYRLGVLYKGHDLGSTWWWESVIFARKYVMVTLVVLFTDQARLGSYLIVWLLEACFVLHLFVHPYANERQHRLETLGLLASIFTYNLGILYMEDYPAIGDVLITSLLYSIHIGMWILFVKSMLAEFKTERKSGLLARAKRDVKLEDDIADEFEALRAKREAQKKRNMRQKEVKKIAGTRVPFADDDLLEKIENASVPEMRADHAKLSASLAAMRETWEQRRQGKKARKYTVDDVRRTSDLTPADRWRQRREEEGRSASTSTAGGSRETWRERMAKRDKERAQKDRA